MFIAKKIRQFRLNKGMTQEDVAVSIGVSGQAVSKWERDECYPDITLLPGLANLFGVTIDELVGMEEISDRNKLWNIHAQANTLQVQGKYHEAAAVYEQAIKTFPADIGLLTAHATTLAMAGEEIDRAIEMCERVLSDNTNDKYRSSVCAVLCFLYNNTGFTDKAVQLSRSRPHARESREFLLPNFLSQQERVKYLHENLPGFLYEICMLIDGKTGTVEEELRTINLGIYKENIDPDIAAHKIAEFLKEPH